MSLALTLVVLALAGAGHRWALWALVVTLPVLLVTLIDLFQERHSLRRNYPASARFRRFFAWLRQFMRPYLVERDLDGSPFSHDERALVYARAQGPEDETPSGQRKMDVEGKSGDGRV